MSAPFPADNRQGCLGQARRCGAWSPDEDDRRAPDPRGAEDLCRGASRALNQSVARASLHKPPEARSFFLAIQCRHSAALAPTLGSPASGEREPPSGAARAASPGKARPRPSRKSRSGDGGTLWLAATGSPRRSQSAGAGTSRRGDIIAAPTRGATDARRLLARGPDGCSWKLFGHAVPAVPSSGG